MNLIDLEAIQSTTDRNLFYLEQIKSTQDSLLNLLKSNYQTEVPLGLYTFNQTKGRGQRNQDWITPLNSAIAISVAFPLNDSFDLILFNKNITLEIADFIQETTPEPIRIKWPNDILLGEKKVAGILMETLSLKDKQMGLVGIGINIFQSNNLSHLPNSTGIWKENSGTLIKLHELSLTLFNRLISLNSQKDVSHQYNQRLNKKNELITVEFKNGERKNVRLKGVDSHGRIQIEDGNKEYRYHHGEVRISL